MSLPAIGCLGLLLTLLGAAFITPVLLPLTEGLQSLDGTAVEPLSPDEFWQQVTAVASYTPPSLVFSTNTPIAPLPTATDGPAIILPTSTAAPSWTPPITSTPLP